MTLPARAVELLTRPDVLAYLATTNADGSPHVAPLWADADPVAGLVLLNTADGRRKVSNMRRDPRVMVALHAPEAMDPPVLIEGTVVEITPEGALEHMHGVSRRYRGTDWEPVPGQVRLIVRIRPDRVSVG
ncbi:MAG TPA: TIGR03618 family F420-dependent PPOX class oxidoreductase [Actinomycetota bacterium]|nr:TIGR03618 family F420-dependent PPOX class oxidoreductase [Actinomycetota bacterium]